MQFNSLEDINKEPHIKSAECTPCQTPYPLTSVPFVSFEVKLLELITKTLLYGDDKFDLSCNKSIISSTIEFVVSTERFSNSLV